MVTPAGFGKGNALARSVHVPHLRRAARETGAAAFARSPQMAGTAAPWMRGLNELLRKNPDVAVVVSLGSLFKLCAATVTYKKRSMSLMEASLAAIQQDDRRNLSNNIFDILYTNGFTFGTLHVAFDPKQKPRNFTFLGEARILRKLKPGQRIWILNNGVGKLAILKGSERSDYEVLREYIEETEALKEQAAAKTSRITVEIDDDSDVLHLAIYWQGR